jgi:hypothetical protein
LAGRRGAVIAIHVDSCLTVFWQLFVLGLWLVTLLSCFFYTRKLLRARMREAALREANITGLAYEKFKPNRGRIVLKLAASVVAMLAILYFYVDFFDDFQCTPDSILWGLRGDWR